VLLGLATIIHVLLGLATIIHVLLGLATIDIHPKTLS